MESIREKIEKGLEIDAEAVERTLVRFIRERVHDARASGVVVGLSGGLDSSVVLILARKALGPRRILGLVLPESGITSPEEVRDAREIAQKMKITWKEIDIAPVINRLEELLGKGTMVSTANLRPRVRMTMLYYHANLLNRLVVGTGNRSELRTGYFTKYGDGGADMMPLGCLYKTQVKKLAEHLGVPARIIEKTPTAGLWRGQTDESELGISYEHLDRIFVGLDLGLRPAEIAKALKLDVEKVKKLLEREKKNLHKLHPPAIPKL